MAPTRPFVASALEKAMLGDAYDRSKQYTYHKDEIQGYGCITEENHDQDASLKLARIQQGIDDGLLQTPQLSTFAGDGLIKATPKAVIEHFRQDPTAITKELAGQLLLRRVDQQQIHMYCQIAADALAEGEKLHEAVT